MRVARASYRQCPGETRGKRALERRTRTARLDQQRRKSALRSNLEQGHLQRMQRCRTHSRDAPCDRPCGFRTARVERYRSDGSAPDRSAGKIHIESGCRYAQHGAFHDHRLSPAQPRVKGRSRRGQTNPMWNIAQTPPRAASPARRYESRCCRRARIRCVSNRGRAQARVRRRRPRAPCRQARGRRQTPIAASARLESDTQPKIPPCALIIASADFWNSGKYDPTQSDSTTHS